MERRSFLKYSGALAGATALGAVSAPNIAQASGKSNPRLEPAMNGQPLQTLSNDLTPYTGAWTPIQVRHLLRRTMLGVPWDQWDAASKMSLPVLVTKLLDTSAGLPPKPATWVDEYLAPDTSITDPKLLDIDTHNKASLEAARVQQLRNWWLDLMLSTNLSIWEKMTFMWSNHFVTGSGVVGHAGYMYQYSQTLRNNALGNLKDLVMAISTDPAMLLYLNGNQSYFGQDPKGNFAGNHVNENFGRELMELFTLGRLDPKTGAANYTETDIRNAGQALSGWQPTTSAPFVGKLLPQCHNTSNKTFFGQTKNFGLTEIIDTIFAQGGGYNIAYFISQRIYTTFVYWVPNPAVIDTMANLLLSSNWEIKPVMSALLSSAHFFDTSVMGAHLKSPVEWVGSMVREFEITYPTFVAQDPAVKSTDAQGYNSYTDPNPSLTYLSETVAAALGQEILNPPNVKGWPTGPDWITTKTFQDRQQMALNLLAYPDPFDGSAGVNGVNLHFKADDWMQSYPGQKDIMIKALSSGIEAHIMGLPPGPVETAALYHVVNVLDLPEGGWHFSVDYGAGYARSIATYPEFQLV